MALPGVTTIVRDKFYGLSRTDIPAGPRVLAIASRTTASGTGGVADLDPVRATDESDVITAFGFGSGCHRAYLELLAGGAPIIYLVALPTATTDANLTATTTGNVFDAAFDAAETAQPDIIVPWGRGGHPFEWDATEDATTPPMVGFTADVAGMAKRVADKVADITSRSAPVFAVMGLSPAVGAAQGLTAAELATRVTLTGLPDKDDAAFGTNGTHLIVVGSEVRTVGYPAEFGYANGASAMAAGLATLNPWSAPTGKIVYNLERNTGLRYLPTRTQQEAIISKGVVPIGTDFERTPRWVDGVTFAKEGSDYARVSTLRTVFSAVQLVRRATLPFVGEASSMENKNAIDTAITSALRGMQALGAIYGASTRISYVPTENKAIVDLSLRVPFEIRVIEVRVSVDL